MTADPHPGQDVERAEKFRRGIGGKYDRDVERLAAEFREHRLSAIARPDGALREAIIEAITPEMLRREDGRDTYAWVRAVAIAAADAVERG